MANPWGRRLAWWLSLDCGAMNMFGPGLTPHVSAVKITALVRRMGDQLSATVKVAVQLIVPLPLSR
jgi:hypothetical protein